MGRVRRNIDLLLIVLVGFILRITISYQHSYTNDELSAINRLRYDNIDDLIEKGVKTGDMHPAGVQVFLKGWSSVFGTGELALRLPFVICGVLSIFVIYFIGLKWFDRRAGIFAAALLSVLYFPVIQSELARPYSPGLLIALLTAWFFYKVLFYEVKKYKDGMFLGLCFATAMYTHYFLFLFVVFIGVTGLFFLNRENFKSYFLATVIGIVLFLPHLPVALYHLQVGGLGWLGPPEKDFLFQFLFYVFNESWMLVTVLLVTLMLSFMTSAPASIFRSKYFVLITVWFFGIYLVGHVLSVVSTPLLKFPVMLFALPFFLLMIGVCISRSGFYKLMLAAVFLAGIFSTIFERDLYGERHMGYREIARHMVDWNKEYGKENIYTVYNLSNPDYMNFYAQQFGDSVDFDWDVIEFADDYAIRNDLLNRTEEYCIVGYSERLTLPNVFETVKEFYPGIIAAYFYDNARVFLMSREENPEIWRAMVSDEPHPPVVLKERDVFQLDLPNPDSICLGTADYCLLNDKILYYPEFVFKTTEVPGIENKYLKIVVEADCPADGQLTAFVSGTRNGKPLIQPNGEVFWMGHDLEEMLITTKNPMGEGSAYWAFKIPDFIKETDELKVSLWNRNGKPIKVYSFEIYGIEDIWSPKTF
jgi:hypothetical protein